MERALFATLSGLHTLDACMHPRTCAGTARLRSPAHVMHLPLSAQAPAQDSCASPCVRVRDGRPVDLAAPSARPPFASFALIVLFVTSHLSIIGSSGTAMDSIIILNRPLNGDPRGRGGCWEYRIWRFWEVRWEFWRFWVGSWGAGGSGWVLHLQGYE